MYISHSCKDPIVISAKLGVFLSRLSSHRKKIRLEKENQRRWSDSCQRSTPSASVRRALRNRALSSMPNPDATILHMAILHMAGLVDQDHSRREVRQKKKKKDGVFWPDFPSFGAAPGPSVGWCSFGQTWNEQPEAPVGPVQWSCLARPIALCSTYSGMYKHIHTQKHIGLI